MRAPRPTLTLIERDAERVILDALNRLDVRMIREQTDAAAWASSPEGERWFADTIATAEERDRIARGRARRARRRRGKLKAKPGNYPRSRNLNYWFARKILPLIQRTLWAYFHAHYPTVPVTKEWAIELTARVLNDEDSFDEDGFRNSLNRGRRRRGGLKK